MAEYKFVDLPVGKFSVERDDIAEAISTQLNEYASNGWTVINAVESRLNRRTGFLLTRQAS